MAAAEHHDQSSPTNRFSDEDLTRIKDFKLGDLPKNSGFVRPFRATFIDERNNNPVQRQWDAIDAHVSRHPRRTRFHPFHRRVRLQSLFTTDRQIRSFWFVSFVQRCTS